MWNNRKNFPMIMQIQWRMWQSCMMHVCVCINYNQHHVASLYGQPEKDLRFHNRSWKASEIQKPQRVAFLQEWPGIVDKNRQFYKEDKTSNFYDQ